MNLQTIANLTTLYNEPHRYYHNLNHVMECLGEFENYLKDNKNSRTFQYAVVESIWWHDAIYNPYSLLNEINSAKLYASESTSSLVEDIIKMTAKHTEDQTFEGKSGWMLTTAHVVLDLDLHSLGKDEKFWINGQNIRKEFHFIPDLVFYGNRIKFFQAMLARKRLFYTDYFFNKYEEKARHNMEDGISECFEIVKDLTANANIKDVF